jgi:hypothetical protein
VARIRARNAGLTTDAFCRVETARRYPVNNSLRISISQVGAISKWGYGGVGDEVLSSVDAVWLECVEVKLDSFRHGIEL